MPQDPRGQSQVNHFVLCVQRRKLIACSTDPGTNTAVDAKKVFNHAEVEGAENQSLRRPENSVRTPK